MRCLQGDNQSRRTRRYVFKELSAEAVDLLSMLGYPGLILRTDGIRVIQQNTPKYNLTSAGLVENAVKQVKEKVRVLVTGARTGGGLVRHSGSAQQREREREHVRWK